MISHFSKAIYLTKAAVIVLGLCSPTKALDVMVLGPLSVAATAASPLVTAYAAPQTAAIYNVFNLISPVCNASASYTMDYQSGGGWMQSSPGIFFGISALRNIAQFGMGIGAAYYSCSYYATGENSYNTIALTLTAVNAVLTTVGTLFMYGINYPNWTSRKNK